jgi:GWxTD domain-containing protein
MEPMKRIAAFAAALLFATSAFAALSPDRADWAKGPVQFLMTDEERAQWSALQTDAQADEFVAQFWARRDPTPGTARNEYRESFDERVAAADKQLTTKNQRGALTDQGKVIILFGPPTRAQRTGGSTTGTLRDRNSAESEDATTPKALWVYEGEVAQKIFNSPHAELEFIDRFNTGDFKLMSGRFDMASAQKRAIAATMTPNAGGTTGGLSAERAAWAKGPVQFLMTPEETAQWNSIKNDADADAFIALFWARRDPTPGTPANEYRAQFNERIDYAEKNFGGGGIRGSLSDRGKVLILFGPPTRAAHTGAGTINAPASPNAIPGSAAEALANPVTEADDTSKLEKFVWIYEGEKAQKAFGAPKAELRFVDRQGTHVYKLETPVFDLASAQRNAVIAAITQPNLTKAPAQTVQTVTVPMPQTPAGPATAFKTASLETAITDAKAGKATTKGAEIEYAEFLAPTGDYYVPIGLYVPASAGLTADDADTFFGAIEDANGNRIEAFEVPAKGILSKNSFFYDHTATLASGTYTATFGLAKAGTPVLVATAPVQTSTLAKEAVGTSRLVLSDIIETIEAAPVKAPFAFGKLKIVPRDQFTNKDELGYFIELHNPGIDPGTNQPKVQAKLDLIQPSGPSISAPLQDVGALPLSGAAGPGEYAIISGVPLGEMKNPLKPGDYTLRVKVVDTVTKKSYTVEQKFKIVG